MTKNDEENGQNGPHIFCCKVCDYTTSKSNHYNRHISTAYHNRRTNDEKIRRKRAQSGQNGPHDNPSKFANNHAPAPEQNTSRPKNEPEYIQHICNCGKQYKHSSSLWNHKQKCKFNNDNHICTNPNINDKELIQTLLNQNAELQNSVIHLLKAGTNNTITNTNANNTNNNNNNNNKTFNLNLFLNETCKDAMNITDFVKNIQIEMQDFEKLGDVGYVNGISNIIVKCLKDMDVASRPIHCTDIKRETLYVKDEDKWGKDEHNHTKVRDAIKNIAHKNTKLLSHFKKDNPDCNKSDSKSSDKYNKLIIECMGGKGDNEEEKENKIIKNISKEITIDK